MGVTIMGMLIIVGVSCGPLWVYSERYLELYCDTKGHNIKFKTYYGKET